MDCKIDNSLSMWFFKPQLKARFKGDKKSFLEFFKKISRGSGIRENTYKSLVDKHADFIEMDKNMESVVGALSPSLGDKFREFFLNYWANLLTYQIPNQFEILYHGVPLMEHSAGQRASALILFILAQQDNDVIKIDQPEDDLDNQTIYEV